MEANAKVCVIHSVAMFFIGCAVELIAWVLKISSFLADDPFSSNF
jgi:hypothetical protein